MWRKKTQVCLDILKTAWTPAWSLQSVCRAIIALLSTSEADSPLNCDAGPLYLSYLHHQLFLFAPQLSAAIAWLYTGSTVKAWLCTSLCAEARGCVAQGIWFVTMTCEATTRWRACTQKSMLFLLRTSMTSPTCLQPCSAGPYS